MWCLTPFMINAHARVETHAFLRLLHFLRFLPICTLRTHTRLLYALDYTRLLYALDYTPRTCYTTLDDKHTGYLNLIFWNYLGSNTEQYLGLVKSHNPLCPPVLRVWTLSLVTNICKMVQTKLTGFLSPPPRPSRDQSQSTPHPNQVSPIGRPQSLPDLPKHVKKKSKRVLKAERKRERKRAKLQRACKNNNVSSVPSQITPTPSPNHCDEPVRNSCDND